MGFLRSVNWLWLVVGIAAGYWVLPRVTSKLGG